MAKTLLKMIITVVILAALFFFALKMWDQQRGQTPLPVDGTPGITSVIKEIAVISSPDGATIQIRDIAGPVFQISPTSEPNGFNIEIPSARLELPVKTYTAPHPLISLIEASDVVDQGISRVRIRVELAPPALYREGFEGTTLRVDIIHGDQTLGAETPTPTPEPMEKKVVEKRKDSKKGKISKTPKKPSTKIARAPKPKPVKTTKPSSSPKPYKPSSEDEKFLEGLGIESGGDQEVIPPPEETTPEVVSKETPMQPSVVEGGAGPQEIPIMNTPLPMKEDDLFGPENPEVAMFTPAPTRPLESFDPGNLAKFPAITDLQISLDGGSTKIEIRRESKTKYKIFRKKDPNRVVVEFLNTQNRLASEYGGFPGTRVQRVQTQQFVSADGSISRITFYISGNAEFEKVDNRKDVFVLRVP